MGLASEIVMIDVNEEKSLGEALEAKQDTIEDIDTIRSGAALGATALQSYTEQYKGTISAVDVGEELDDVVEYATKTYVDNAIVGAINKSY